MKINDRSVLLSIRQEADRQAAFYLRKLNDPLAQAWSDIGSLADQALREGLFGSSLSIELLNTQGKELVKTPPIKGCEQVEQLPNTNVIKAFR